jgi:hypothetical protein
VVLLFSSRLRATAKSVPAAEMLGMYLGVRTCTPLKWRAKEPLADSFSSSNHF